MSVEVNESNRQRLKSLLEKYHVEILQGKDECEIIQRILAPFHSSIDYSKGLKAPTHWWDIPDCYIPDFNNLDLENGFQYINELLMVINRAYKDKGFKQKEGLFPLGQNSMTPLHYFIESIAIIKNCSIEKFRNNLIKKISEAELLKPYYPDKSMEKQLSRKFDEKWALINNLTSDGLLNLLESLSSKDVLKITKEECEKLINDAQDENFKRLFSKPESSSYPANIIERIYREIKDTFEDGIINFKNTKGLTPLALACAHGVYEMVELLLFPGGILDEHVMPDTVKSTFPDAIFIGYPKVVETLLKHPEINVNIGILNKYNEETFPLIHACTEGHFEVVELLLKNSKINVNIQNNDGDTPLKKACGDTDYFKIVELLLKRSDIDVNIKNNIYGNTPLITACLRENLRAAQLLLGKSNINVNIQNNDGDTALIIACRDRSIGSVKLLLEHSDINVNIQNNDGDTALIVTCQDNNNLEGVKLLLERSDINVNIQNKKGNTPLAVAFTIWPTYYIHRNPYKTRELLLERSDINVNIQNNEGDTPLIQACRETNPKWVKLLLKNSNINVNIQNNNGDTPLIIACLIENLRAAELLLEHSNIDVNIKNKDGDTSLFVSLLPLIDNEDLSPVQLEVFKWLMGKIEPEKNFADYNYPLNQSQKETLKLIYQTLVIEKNHGPLKSIFSETPLTYENMNETLSANKEELKKALGYLYKSNIKNNVGREHRKAPLFFILDLNVKYEEDTCFKKLKDYLTEHPDPNSVRPQIGITSYNEASGVKKEDTFYHDFPGNESSDYGGLTKHYLNCLRENIIRILQRDIENSDFQWVLSHFKEIIRFYNINDFNFYLHIQEFITIFGKGIIENTLAFYLSMGNPVGVCILHAYLNNHFEIPPNFDQAYPDEEDNKKEKRACQHKTNQDMYSKYNTYLDDHGFNKFQQLCANLFNNTNLLVEILSFFNEHLLDYTLEDMNSLIDKIVVVNESNEIVVDDTALYYLEKFKELLEFSSTDMNKEQQMAIYKKLFLFWTAEEYPSGKLTLQFVRGDTSLNSHTCFNQLTISKNYLENFKTKNLKIQELIGN